MKRNICTGLGVLTMIVAAQPAAAASSGSLNHMSMEMIRSDGARARLLFLPNHTLKFEGLKLKDVMDGHGTYTVSRKEFCYQTDFPGSECWMLAQPLRVGKPVVGIIAGGSVRATLTLRKGVDALLPKGA